MNYELAVKLKDAGFPQNKYPLSNYIFHKDGEKDNLGIQGEREYEFPSSCYIPTLSELIEACGNEYNNFVLMRTNKSWNCGTGNGISEGVTGKENCPSPEEAVANLWLELNKK